jgi:hypothetical protein
MAGSTSKGFVMMQETASQDADIKLTIHIKAGSTSQDGEIK